MPKCSLAKRDFRDYGDNGERKIKKREEGASLSTRNVDEDLVRSFCLFTVMAPLFTFSRIRGKLIWFLVQHNLTSSDFLEWKKRLIHEEANIFIILLSWSSLKREPVLFSMIERWGWGTMEDEERYLRFLVSGVIHSGAMTLCKTPERQTIATFLLLGGFWATTFLSDARQPEVNLFSFNMPCRFQICIPKSLFSYRDDLPKNLFKIIAQECKKSTSGWRASLKMVNAS